MSFVKCFDVVSMLTNEATEQFGSTSVLNQDKEEALRKICSDIDELSEQYNGISFEVSIDDMTTEITVSLVCDEIIIERDNERIYDVIKKTNRFTVKRAKDVEAIQIDFVFPGIWDKDI